MSEISSDHWLLHDERRDVSRFGNEQFAEAARGCLFIEEYPDLEPLDAQFGELHKLSVPEALQNVLFAPLQTEGEQAQSNSKLYGIVDAAKMPYLLTGLLDSSDLEYHSLFDGAARQELEDHAPYLVRLENGNAFTRSLFTESDRQNDLWGADIGILFRSSAEMSDLRKHFRRYSRVQDTNEKWFFFRFWEPRVLAHYFREKQFHPLEVGRWFYGTKGLNIDRYIMLGPRASYVISSDPDVEEMRQSTLQKFRIDEDVKRMWRNLSHLEFVHQLHSELLNNPDTGSGANPLGLKSFVSEQVQLAQKAGITLEGSIADVVTAACLIRTSLSCFPPDMATLLEHKRLPQMSRAKKLKQMALTLKAERSRYDLEI